MNFSWHESLWASRFRNTELPQALLLTAARGTGEIEFALRVSNSRLCSNVGPSGDACGHCDDCRWFTAGTHPDFRRLDPTLEREDTEAGEDEPKSTDRERKKARTQISVDEIREVIEFLQVAAHRNGFRVVLIHPAHAMNAAAANALLKVLEEPPARALFLLVSAQPARLPATIRSRCVSLALPRPSPEQATSWLLNAGQADPALALAQVGGAPTAALELDERYWTARKALLPLLAGRDPDWTAAAARIGEADVPQLVQILQTWCWDLASARIGGDVRYHPDEARSIARVANDVGGIDLVDFARRLVAARRLVGHPLNAKLFVEDLLMSYARLTHG